MRYLIDTNVLLSWAFHARRDHDGAAAAIEQLIDREDSLELCPQNLIEFWNVATRPIASNGLGLSIGEADRSIDLMESIFTRLDEVPEIFDHWRRLVIDCAVSGKQVHDARIAAVMLVYGVSHILTFNTSDFKRFPGIVAIAPNEVATNR